ncbi:protein RAE1 isoform X1 [Juglans microcarpa x Juglans regia]|uniref:protein RAE1 isoform X1 n=2 Tax=Juglans microcarpa x Juglans regia TaxID=2249226 RepID=UPI001B7EC47A|nr:protein RAE1 isoform X1 [Juglans microcarpa x Juglans regia]
MPAPFTVSQLISGSNFEAKFPLSLSLSHGFGVSGGLSLSLSLSLSNLLVVVVSEVPMSAFGTPTAPNPNPNKSFEVAQPPSDSVSSLSFSPKANYLVATSWDNQVRCWEIMHSGAVVGSTPKASISHDQPVLCSTWKDDGTTVFSGGCDKQAKMWPLSGGQPMTVAMHDAPIKEIAWIPEMNLLVTGSWDKTLKYWDTRQSNPVHTQQLPDRCYALTVRHPLMVVGTADRNLIVFNLQNPQTEFKRITSPLKYQTRCVTAFPDQQGFLVGSIEGRVGVHHLDDSQQSKNFTFKCHRDGNEIYSVNSLNFHPVHHTFATAGSDGAFNFWDKDSKQRLKAMARCSQPIPCSTFNNDGSLFAYSSCYDWSKGAENHNPATAKSHIFLHLPQESEVKSKPRNTTGRK